METFERAIDDMRGLVRYRARVERTLERRFVETLAFHRERGVPWVVLAQGLGVRKQTAHKAWARLVARRLAAGTATVPGESDDDTGALMPPLRPPNPDHERPDPA